MATQGLFSLGGVLPISNLGPEIIAANTTLLNFRGRRETPGAAGTTEVQLELNSVGIPGAILTWTPADGVFELKTVEIAVPVIIGDRLSIIINSRESDPAEGLSSEASD